VRKTFKSIAGRRSERPQAVSSKWVTVEVVDLKGAARKVDLPRGSVFPNRPEPAVSRAQG
jgi:hypothetical protein